MGRKLRAIEQRGVFPGYGGPDRYHERHTVIRRALARRAGLPDPDRRESSYENLGNRTLPVWKSKAKIQETIRDNQFSMIEGPTGSGKSTQVAQYALEMGYKKVVYLEPRIPLADNLSDRLIAELSDQLGVDVGDELVGVRHSERSTGNGKVIEVMTPDTFLRVFDQLQEHANDPVLIIGDEIHEKDFPTELGVAVAAQALTDHPKWRLCVMSATLDAQPIREVYERKLEANVPLVSVEGRPFAVEMIEEPDLTATQAYEKYRDAHEKAQIFTAGKQEIHDMTDEIEKRKYPKTRITPFHAKLSRKNILQATKGVLRPGEKQVIPSTNAGASGITIPGLTLVISDGTVRRADLDEDGTPGLFLNECSKDELMQQAGRAGRDVPGGVFVLVKPDDEENFTFTSFDRRDPHAPAQIYQTNISRNVLATVALGHNFHELNQWLVHGVRDKTVIEAYDTLYRLGAIDSRNEITDIGAAMNRFPLRPELSRALVQGLRSKADKSMIRKLVATISAVEAGGLPYFERGIGSAWRGDIRHDVEDDYMAQLDMFIATRQFYDGDTVDEDALERRNYDLKQTEKAHKTYDKITRILRMHDDFELSAPSPDEVEELRSYLIAGLFDYAYTQVGSRSSSSGPMYTSVYDPDGPQHELSDRGVYKGGRSADLVVGWPRRFEKRVKGALTEFSTIEVVMPTTVQELGRVADKLLTMQFKSQEIDASGRLVSRMQRMLGHIVIEEVVSQAPVSLDEQSRALLREGALKRHTQALGELLAIKKELEQLVRLLPVDELAEYFPDGILTDSWLRLRMDEAIRDDVRDVYELDNKLRRMIVIEKIGRSTWIADDRREEILMRSPEYLRIGDAEYRLYYSEGTPLINGFNLRDVDALPASGLFLEDGREIFINYAIDRDDPTKRSTSTRRCSTGDIKLYASTL